LDSNPWSDLVSLSHDGLPIDALETFCNLTRAELLMQTALLGGMFLNIICQHWMRP
jgi:hypothetical protein